ncbi:unnamed protein product [Kuraishia capsulata CBS 1993]|uniref:BHLH domain-containing protein n=1 Tax=Kuraishia capsulata CBS 1993 TaxID=1382522 RepID=W6MTH3_9ASCO|nr:uncharacterized protein KUCA_T00006019001 [Kuraishia capsulata CBS 1993]CDK30024.1 unnamed protein product [Kuraishia capsulata CBS 1993]
MSHQQKRAKKDESGPDSKHFKPNDVAVAALKYDNGAKDQEMAIDSELLTAAAQNATADRGADQQIPQQNQDPGVDQLYSRYQQQQTQQHSNGDTEVKPAAGSDEWHRQRKHTHKEVERRRRESINTGIRQLAELLPRQDTNKAQVLGRAVEYIKQLKETENSNIEKWTLEKLITDQAVSELATSNDKLKVELEKAYRENESLKREIERLKR